MEQIASASDWIPGAINAALLGALFIACHIDNARQTNERHEETAEMLRDVVTMVNDHHEAMQRDQEAFISAQCAAMQIAIDRSKDVLQQQMVIDRLHIVGNIAQQGGHTDDLIQRVLTRPEARVTPPVKGA